MSGTRTQNGRMKMRTDPTEDRRRAGEAVMKAYDELCEAAGLPVDDEESL